MERKELGTLGGGRSSCKNKKHLCASLFGEWQITVDREEYAGQGDRGETTKRARGLPCVMRSEVHSSYKREPQSMIINFSMMPAYLISLCLLQVFVALQRLRKSRFSWGTTKATGNLVPDRLTDFHTLSITLLGKWKRSL